MTEASEKKSIYTAIVAMLAIFGSKADKIGCPITEIS